jgi:plastocyanin
MSSKSSTAVGAIVAILIVGAVAVLGYYQVVVAPNITSPSSSSTVTIVCPSSQCANVTIPNGVQIAPTGYVSGSKTTFGYTSDTVKVIIGVNNTLYWTNADSAIHTATSDPGQGVTFDTGNINPGSSAQITITVPGTYTYHCTYHAWMQGKIMVLPGTTSTSTSSSTSK